MATIRLTWVLPAVAPAQRPIAHTLVEISAAPEEAGWTEHRVLPADAVQQVDFADAAPGEHHYRLTVIDIDGRRSTPVVVSVTVESVGPSPVEAAAARIV